MDHHVTDSRASGASEELLQTRFSFIILNWARSTRASRDQGLVQNIGIAGTRGWYKKNSTGQDVGTIYGTAMLAELINNFLT
jgi:hypothetical protein